MHEDMKTPKPNPAEEGEHPHLAFEVEADIFASQCLNEIRYVPFHRGATIKLFDLGRLFTGFYFA